MALFQSEVDPDNVMGTCRQGSRVLVPIRLLPCPVLPLLRYITCSPVASTTGRCSTTPSDLICILVSLTSRQHLAAPSCLHSITLPPPNLPLSGSSQPRPRRPMHSLPFTGTRGTRTRCTLRWALPWACSRAARNRTTAGAASTL